MDNSPSFDLFYHRDDDDGDLVQDAVVPKCEPLTETMTIDGIVPDIDDNNLEQPIDATNIVRYQVQDVRNIEEHENYPEINEENIYRDGVRMNVSDNFYNLLNYETPYPRNNEDIIVLPDIVFPNGSNMETNEAEAADLHTAG